MTKTVHSTITPKLYHNPSSYFSMIARLALAEADIDHEQVFVDIHFRGSQHTPAYAKINPHMTVPTLALPGRVMFESREILEFAFAKSEQPQDAETTSWVDLHYSFPVEELTFGGFLVHHALFRAMIPAKMAASRRRLLQLATAYPELADTYKKRAAVFAEREQTFNPNTAVKLLEMRRNEAIALMDQLTRHLASRDVVTVSSSYGAADVVWTVFLARMEFTGLKDEIASRPALARYWNAIKSRPSFAAADIWTRLHLGRLILGVVVN